MLTELDAGFAVLGPWAEALLRACVGLALVPHALRNTFNMFPTTGQPHRSIVVLANYLDKQGYRPGTVWAPAISATQLICGPLLALGLFTRLAAVPVVLFLLVSNIERWRKKARKKSRAFILRIFRRFRQSAERRNSS